MPSTAQPELDTATPHAQKDFGCVCTTKEWFILEQICERNIIFFLFFIFFLPCHFQMIKCVGHVLAHGELSSNTVGIGCISYWSMQLETKQNFTSSTMNRKVSLCSKLFKPFFFEPLKVKIKKSCSEWYVLIPFIMI